MNFEDFENLEDFHDEEMEALNRLIEAYEELYKAGEYSFYDIEEFQSLIEHFALEEEHDKMEYALKNADEIYPDHPLFYLVRSFIASYHDNMEEAEEWVKKANEAIEDSDYDKGTFFQKRAEIYAEFEEFFQSLLDFEEALKHNNPEKEFIIDQMEDLYLVLFNLTFEEDGGHPRPIFVEEIINYIQDNHYLFALTHYPEQALKFLRYLTREKPLISKLWFYYGMALRANQDLLEAIEAFDFSLALTPDLTYASYYKSQTLKDLGKNEEAIKILVNIDFLEDESGLIYFEIAENFVELVRYEEAAKYYKLSIAKDNRVSDSYYALAKIYAYFVEDSTTALSYIEKAIGIDKTSPIYQLLLADILALEGNFSEAEKSYKESLKINPDFSEAWLNYSDIYAKQNQFDKAIEILDSQLEKEFIDGSLFARRFNYLWKSGRKQEAFDNLTALLHSAEESIPEIFEYDKQLASDPELLKFVNEAIETSDDLEEDEQ